jgi:hypothetical protein
MKRLPGALRAMIHNRGQFFVGRHVYRRQRPTALVTEWAALVGCVCLL